jgi:hypothetical protein
VDFRDAEISGDVILEDAEIEQPVRFDGAEVGGRFRCTGAVFHRSLSLSNVSIAGRSTMDQARFYNSVDITGAIFDAPVTLSGSIFDRGIAADGVQLASRVDMINTNFKQLASFRSANFEGYANFDGPEFHLDARFDRSEFTGPVFFETTKFHQVGVFRDVTFRSSVSFRNISVAERADFQNAEFRDAALFPGAQFREVAAFDRTVFENKTSFQAATITTLQFAPDINELESINFSDSDIENGYVHVDSRSFPVIDFSGAVIGDLELQSDRELNVLRYVRLLDVTYDGFRFETIEDALEELNYRLATTPVSDYSRSEPESRHHRNGYLPLVRLVSALYTGISPNRSIRAGGTETDRILELSYRKAKDGADQAGNTRAASNFFQLEMTYRRHRYARQVRDNSSNGFERAVAAFRWIANGSLYVTSGYGERPSWTILTSVVVIASFSVIYAARGVYESQFRGVGGVLFSLESFVTLIVGEAPSSPSVAVQFVSALEGFLGAFLIALFVFALTRTIHR